MPFYRTAKLGIVHMRGTGLPKPCIAKVLINGKEMVCLVASEYLCDGQSQTPGTCDVPLCPAHAREIGRNRHLCPACHLRHRSTQPDLFTGLLNETNP